MRSVAILTERLKTGFGVDLVVHEQAKRLQEQLGFEVAVLAIEVEPSFYQTAPYSIKNLSVPLAFNPLTQDFIATKRYGTYRHLLKTFDAFIVHTPCFHSWIPWLRAQGKPVIAVYYGNSPSNEYPFPKKLRQPILEFSQNNLYYPFVNQIFTISQFLKNNLPPQHRAKTKVFPLGHEHVSVAGQTITSKEIESFRKRYFIPAEERLITYIGRLNPDINPYKNTRLLLRLNQVLKSARLPFPVKILAMGVAENNAEVEFLSQGIRVIPQASQADLVAALKTSTLHISPSLWEGFNLPLLEAQSMGLPVIGFDRGAHSEVVTEGVGGYLVNDEAAFFERVLQLLKNTKLRTQMGKQALEKSTHFSWDASAAALAKSLKSLL